MLATAEITSSPVPWLPLRPATPTYLKVSRPWLPQASAHRGKRWWQELPTCQGLCKGCLSKGGPQLWLARLLDWGLAAYTCQQGLLELWKTGLVHGWGEAPGGLS